MLGDYLSMTNLVSVLFLGYMGNNIMNLGKFWFPELCEEDAKLNDCLRPMSFPEDQLFTAEIWFVRKSVQVESNLLCWLLNSAEKIFLRFSCFAPKRKIIPATIFR